MSVNIKQYTVAELRDKIDKLLADNQLRLDSPVLIDDYEGNCDTNGISHLCIYAASGRLYLCCDFGGDISEEVQARARCILNPPKITGQKTSTQ